MEINQVDKSKVPTITFSRNDFVKSYIGQSKEYTIKLLNQNRDKHIIIEEAQNICYNEQDDYGLEVMNAIENFKRNNPDVLIEFK